MPGWGLKYLTRWPAATLTAFGEDPFGHGKAVASLYMPGPSSRVTDTATE